jgi:hypothetical protein
MAPTLNWRDATVEHGVLEVHLSAPADARITKPWLEALRESLRAAGRRDIVVHDDHRVMVAGVQDPATLKRELNDFVANADGLLARRLESEDAEVTRLADQARRRRERDARLQEAFRDEFPHQAPS